VLEDSSWECGGSSLLVGGGPSLIALGFCCAVSASLISLFVGCGCPLFVSAVSLARMLSPFRPKANTLRSNAQKSFEKGIMSHGKYLSLEEARKKDKRNTSFYFSIPRHLGPIGSWRSAVIGFEGL